MSGVQGQSIWNALQRAEERCKVELSATERELQHTLYGYESRLVRLRYAIKASGPLACRTLVTTLEGIKLDAIWNILYGIVHDIALYYGGSVVAGTAMGAAAGSLAGGIGAAPGAAVGFGAGQLMGTWVMTFLGLKMFAEGLSDTIPQAFALYWKAFRAVWGPIAGDPHDARYRADFALSEDQAAHHFAHGHVLMIMAILMALVAWLTRGGTSEEALMQAVRQSERLGAKMADWLTENKQKLIDHPRLRPVLRERAPSQEAKPDPLSNKRNPSGSQKGANVPKADSDVRSTSGPQVVKGSGSSVEMMGHKIYDPGYSPLSTNPSAQYRFSDPTYRQTGGDVYFGENLSTSYYEVRQNVAGKSLFVGDVRVDNVLDLTDENVLNQMNIDPSKLLARVDSPLEQKAVYGYTNQIANQAYDAGYNGILYPSTRGPGNAVVLFGGRYDPTLISPVVDFSLQ